MGSIMFFYKRRKLFLIHLSRNINIQFSNKMEGKRTKEVTSGQIRSSSKIGGEFIKINNGEAEFLKSREKYFIELFEKQEEKYTKIEKKDIVITLPDGNTMDGQTWVTTPLDIAKRIS